MHEYDSEGDLWPSSEEQWDRAEARELGEANPDRAWINTDRDVWHKNPFYQGPPVPHPDSSMNTISPESRMDEKNELLTPLFYARCGFCGAIVDGDTTSIALESEAEVAHPNSIVRRIPGTTDTEVFCCDDGHGCMK